MTPATRRQRQRDTIAGAAAGGDVARATALLAEHVVEFPEDAGLLDGLVAAGRPPPTDRG